MNADYLFSLDFIWSPARVWSVAWNGLPVFLKSNHIREQKYYSLISNWPFYKGLNQFFHSLSVLHMHPFLCDADVYGNIIAVVEETSNQNCRIWLSQYFLNVSMPWTTQLILWSCSLEIIKSQVFHSYKLHIIDILDKETRTWQF